MLNLISLLCLIVFTSFTSAQSTNGPTAVIVDTVTYGSDRGVGVFFYLASEGGRDVKRTAHSETRLATSGRGGTMVLAKAERVVPAGKTKLKLIGRVDHAAPIGSIFASVFKAEGVPYFETEAEVELQPDTRYRINGIIDNFKREIWLEDDITKRIVGEKIIIKADEKALAKMQGAAYACCNLRYSADWISDANWVTLPFIPAGTRIKLEDYGRHKASVLVEGRPMRIGNDYGRESETREQLIAKLLVNEDPKIKLDAYPQPIQAAIKEGKVSLAMNKEQVIMALGYPRADTTRSLDKELWVYYVLDGREFNVIWHVDGSIKSFEGTQDVKALFIVSS